MANEYLKPQIPLKDLNSENYFYPLTTIDQVLLQDNSTRLNSLINKSDFTANNAVYFNGTKLLTSTTVFLNNYSIDFNKAADTAILRNYYNSTWYNLLRNHNNGNISISASSSGLYVGYENTTLIDFLHSKMTFKNDRYCLNIYPSGGSYADGIRIYHRSSDGNWSGLTLVGNDLNAETGTSANTWFFGNNKGSLFISRNGSGESGTGYLRSYISNNAGYWKIGQRVGINGENSNYNLYVSGDTLTSGSFHAYGAGYLRSKTVASVWPYIAIDTKAGESDRNSSFQTYTTVAQDTWAQLFYQIPAIRKTYEDATSTTVTATYQYPAYWFFRCYSANTNGTRTSYFEDFGLPTVNFSRTSNASYTIVTTKNPEALYWANNPCTTASKTDCSIIAENDHDFVSHGNEFNIVPNIASNIELHLNHRQKGGNGAGRITRTHIKNGGGGYSQVMADQFISNTSVSYRMLNNNRAVFWHWNGSTPCFYLMFTAANDQYGSWTSQRPFYVRADTAYSYFTRAYSAVWNDYAEYRQGKITEPGRVVIEHKTGIMQLCEERLAASAKIISDTYGFAIGQTKKAQTPIAVSGRVLVYPYQDKNKYELGAAVCAAPGGTVDIMTREEIREYPERIIGTVSEIPDYEIWHAGGDCEQGPAEEIKVNGRIWVYVR